MCKAAKGLHAGDDGFCCGRVSAYGKIGELAGYERATREMGVAMSRAPDERTLPCHRVVNQNGTLAPGYAFGTKEKQREILVSEGIAFLPDGTTQVRKHL